MADSFSRGAARGAITWKLKWQTIIMLSSMEAEYVALSEAGCKACWLQSLHEELGLPQKSVTIIKGDNKGLIILTKDPQFHNQSKHIEIQHGWIQDLVQNKLISIHSCCDPNQTADVLTKALPKPKHTQHTMEMGIRTINGQ